MKPSALAIPLMLFVLSACTRQPTPASANTPQTSPTSSTNDQAELGNQSVPALDSRFVFDVQIGNTLTPDGKLAAALTDFELGDTIQVAVSVRGKGGAKLRVELQDATNAVLETQDTNIDTIDDYYLLAFAPGDKRLVGSHRILVLLDDKPVWEKPLTFK